MKLKDLEAHLKKVQAQIYSLRAANTVIAQNTRGSSGGGSGVTLSQAVNLLRNGQAGHSVCTWNATTAGGLCGSDRDYECAKMYSHPANTAVERFDGNITSGDNTLTIGSGGTRFAAGDATAPGNEIEVFGAGTAGANLRTTIASFTNDGELELTAPAATTVTNVRIRWRLQPLYLNDTFTGGSPNNSLKSSAHSAYSSADPDWARTEGWIQIGSTKTLDIPVQNTVLEASKILHVYFKVAKASSGVAVTATQRIYVGLYDNTPSIRNWMEGTRFKITHSVVGAPVGTVSRNYKVFLYSDRGYVYESETLNVANAPDDNSFNNLTYVALSWTNIPGIIAAKIYRETAGVYRFLKALPASYSYNDNNSYEPIAVTGYPTGDTYFPRAYVATLTGDLQDVIANGSGDWPFILLSIQIPPTYNRTDSTGEQILRIGLTEAQAGAREIYLDDILLSFDEGSFSQHVDDTTRLRNPVNTPAQSTSGGSGGGGGSGEGGGGGVSCMELESTFIELFEDVGQTSVETFEELSPGMAIVSADPIHPSVITGLKHNRTSSLIVVRAGGHMIRVTETHKFITSFTDVLGTSCSLLNVGDDVIVRTPDGKGFTKAPIEEKSWISGDFKIVSVSLLPGRRTFVANGFLSHNRKLFGL